MKRAAVFFDRDNTLLVSDGYLGDADKVVLMEGAPEAVAKARQLGFVVVTVSNQSGVARGMFSEDAVHAVNRRMDELLQQARPAAVIARHEFCPFHPQGTVERYCQDSYLRKPKPGMILQAADKLNLDLSRSWLIGDTPRDIEAGRAAGVRTVLFKHPGIPASPDVSAPSDVKPDFEATSLAEAMEIVGREAFKRLSPGAASATPNSPPTASADTSADASDQPNPETSPNPPTGPAATIIRVDEEDNLTPEEAEDITESARLIPPAATPAAPAPAAVPPDMSSAVEPVLAAPEPSAAQPQASIMATPAPAAGGTPAEPIHAPASLPAVALAPGEAPPPAADPAPTPSPSHTPLTAPPATPTPAPTSHSSKRVPPELVAHIETLLEQVLVEMRRRREQPEGDFSVPKLLAGIVQIIALGMLFMAYLNRREPMGGTLLLFATYFQVLTISLLIMGRQK